jgi:predicted transcriptional regulator of viral defense system
MNYIDFKNKMFSLACFSINQIYAWQPGFDRNNLSRWIKKGLLIRLRQGYFTFPEYKGKPGFAFYFANRIYRPSYISLHSALAFYGIIPESVVQVTSVTSLKTASFSNDFGEYSYHTIKEVLMFGYDLKPMGEGTTLQIARPEKALLDLLYLYPSYNSVKEFEDLRLDEDFVQEDLNKELLLDYTRQFKNKALEKKVQMLFITYNLC